LIVVSPLVLPQLALRNWHLAMPKSLQCVEAISRLMLRLKKLSGQPGNIPDGKKLGFREMLELNGFHRSSLDWK
jgi:hypothetical protein